MEDEVVMTETGWMDRAEFPRPYKVKVSVEGNVTHVGLWNGCTNDLARRVNVSIVLMPDTEQAIVAATGALRMYSSEWPTIVRLWLK